MRKHMINSLFLFFTMVISCQIENKTRKILDNTDFLYEAIKLKEKYPNQDIEIHKLDSAAFFNHQIYSRLSPGTLFRIGKEQSEEADMYKLLSQNHIGNDSDSIYYYVLQIHIK